MATKYDPQKAHEYYMKRRKLKGRKKKKSSTKKKSINKLIEALSEAGKAQAMEAQARINVEKKAFNKKLNEIIKAKIKEVQAMAGSDEEKALAAERIRLEYKEVKKQAAALFKDKLRQEIESIK